MIVREGHFQRVQRQIDVGAVLIAARRRVALHHLHRVLRQRARRRFLPSPIRIRELGDDFAPFLQRVQHSRDVEFAVQGGLHADFDIVKIDEHGDLEFLFHVEILTFGNGRAGPSGPPRRKRHSLIFGLAVRR